MLKAFVLSAVFLAASLPLGAQVTATRTLTPGANGITASSVYLPDILGDPEPGGDFTQWTGTGTAQLDDAFHPTTLSIVAANLVAQNSGTYSPALLGVPGGPPAPADYAFARYRVGATAGFPTNNALRDLKGTLGSTPLAPQAPLATTPSPLRASDLRSPMDAWTTAPSWATAPTAAPSRSPAGARTSPPRGGATLATDGAFVSLQLPLDLTIVTNLPAGPQSAFPVSFRFVGTLNATGAIPEPGTWALAALGLSGLALSLRRRKN